MSKVKNDREFPVEVTYKDGDKDVNVTIEPDQEVEVTEDQLEAVQKQVADAEAPEDAGEARAAEGEGEESPAENSEGTPEGDNTNLSESDKAKRELAEAKAEIRKRDIEDQYQTALKEGKVVPAQETAFKALAEALHGQTRQLSDGTSQNLSEVLADFVAKAPKVVSLDEENGKNADESDKGPLAKLSEESKQGLAKMRVSDEDFAKYGTKENISVNELGAQNG